MLEFTAVAAVTALTVWAVAVKGVRRHDMDGAFWFGFAGLCALAPAILPAAANNPGTVPVLLAWGALVSVATLLLLRRHDRRSRQAGLLAAESTVLHALAARHDAVISRWHTYELDVGRCIDFPAMSDVRVPETSALVRAMAEAARLRPGTRIQNPGAAPAYGAAVERLEEAFRTAERAAIGAAADDGGTLR